MNSERKCGRFQNFEGQWLFICICFLDFFSRSKTLELVTLELPDTSGASVLGTAFFLKIPFNSSGLQGIGGFRK